MLKGIFIDYTGTTVQETGKEIEEVVMRICRSSDLHEPKEAVALWWKWLKEYEEKSYKETYLTEDEIVDRVLEHLKKDINLRENFEELHRLFQQFWIHAPAFPEVRDFFERCPLPIYIISNNGIQYLEKAMEDKGLTPAGLVCADMVKAYKPHRELFEKALEVSGFSADEVLHVGDSYSSDIIGAKSAGITPILVQRTGGKTYPDVTIVRNLMEVLPLIQEEI
ncbi:HAD family hydrolase [Bariatricus massiliensis]|uniref:HAD family hydrolase n=1 Tax=Bariatricus massiliensis TaxID=1745713 RepID=A0ABS8DF34_9FIRM|nr:HAD family hydrolase [Bariatricus massiliensis]MCB7303913.1 HAD family hydrolase [Bariatricus massiliensis]MCB7374656.1 HAD family hydrolase [Bariatricus massiliensis]MCB7387023.1 HAD family hydrolase [Bariatricus massiliensis]MCB7411185.1 HAD family hydrolase [Bariatricus massiliensis]MCQ5252871.1 HAD family hydrolase [Bariatricus massiliensis]